MPAPVGSAAAFAFSTLQSCFCFFGAKPHTPHLYCPREVGRPAMEYGLRCLRGLLPAAWRAAATTSSSGEEWAVVAATTIALSACARCPRVGVGAVYWMGAGGATVSPCLFCMRAWRPSAAAAVLGEGSGRFRSGVGLAVLAVLGEVRIVACSRLK